MNEVIPPAAIHLAAGAFHLIPFFTPRSKVPA